MCNPEPNDHYVAAIIAGGAARRLHGMAPMGLKTLLPFAEYGSILEYLLNVLTEQTPPPRDIALNIHPEQLDYLERWLDEHTSPPVLALVRQCLVLDAAAKHNPDREGPMSGIAAALSWAKSWTRKHSLCARWLLTVSGDTIDLPPDLVARLLQAAANNPDAQWLVAANTDHIQPPISLWRTDIIDQVLKQYHRGERKIDRIARKFPHQQVVWPDCTFGNVNSPSQYQNYFG